MEQAYRFGEKLVTPEIIETVMAPDLNALVPTFVLVQWKSEFWPAVLSWLSGVVTTSVWEDEAPTAAHRHGNIKTMRPALVKELPYGIPP
jgi:hypothetical protein